jgi:hypothetical protein
MGPCVDLLREYWGVAAFGTAMLLFIGGYGVIKLKHFLPVLRTLVSNAQEYPVGSWNCLWQHDVVSGELPRPDISDVVTINFAREEVVIGSGVGGEMVKGYNLVGRCTSSCVALTYRIADESRPYAGSVVLHKRNERRLEGRFVQYIVASDGSTAGLLSGRTVWSKI